MFKIKLLSSSMVVAGVLGSFLFYQNCSQFKVSSSLSETKDFNLRTNFLSSLDGLTLNNGSSNFGNGSISANVNNSELRISTTARLAGSIGSLTFRGKEYINDDDHGRELQSASSYDGFGECLNPTEAGSFPDGEGATSTSYLTGYSASGNQLKSATQMAYWLSARQSYIVPGGCGGRSNLVNAQNTTDRSNDILYKQVTIGYSGLANVIEYLVTFHVAEPHQSATFEAVTGYLARDFSLFLTLNPTSNTLNEINHDAGEQKLPIILATQDRNHAMGIYSPDLPEIAFPDVGYGRFDFAPQNTMKWNAVYRTGAISVGDYSYRQFVIVGTVSEVQNSMLALHRKFHSIQVPKSMDVSILKINHPLESEVIPIGSNELKLSVVADKTGEVPLKIQLGATVLQSETLQLSGTDFSKTVILNDAVKNHRGDFLTLNVGGVERKIGIGFSFVVAGQSNSVDSECTECLNQNIRFSSSPRVLALRDKSEAVNVDVSGEYGAFAEINNDNYKFEPLRDSSTYIHGAGLNVWNRVGKSISDRYNVPVSFIIIGKGGTTTSEWISSLVHRFQLAQGFKFTGVLWHQGESDAISSYSLAVRSKEEYINNLKTIINTAKINYGISSPWMIAQASICTEAGTNSTSEQMILNAQSEFVQRANSLGVSQAVYLGPNTNLISHTCHFDSLASFNAYAESWTSSLISSGILNQQPPTNNPVNGGWSGWSNQGTCSKTCGGGQVTQVRSCTNPAPANGGSQCSGASSQVVSCNSQACAPTAGEVIGVFENALLNGRQTTLTGWACAKGIEQSIQVHIYYNGPAGVGTILTSGLADVARESAVSTSCGVSGSLHGFNIQLSEAQSVLVSNKKIYVYGISVSGAYSNNQLVNSGKIAPTVQVNTPVNGGWSGWSDQGTCSKTCGGGQVTQVRSCTSPAPANGGAQCSGASSQVISCNSHACTPTEHPTSNYQKRNVYRFYHPTGGHFFTLSSAEGINASFTSEGIGFKTFSDSVSDAKTVYIYRCLNSANGHHFVSVDPNCEGRVQEGNLGKVYTSQEANLVPLYRLYSAGSQDHLITTNTAEVTGSGYTLEGILGYVAP